MAGTKKGQTNAGDLFNSPFALGNVDANYTSNRVVESFDSYTSGTTKLAWTPVVADSVVFLDADGNKLTPSTTVTVADDGTVTATVSGTVKKIAYIYDNVVIPQNDLPTLTAKMESIPLIAKARRIAVKSYAA